MTAKRINLIITAIVAIGVLAWLGFAVYAEQPGAGEMAEDMSEHDAMMAQPKEATNGQARLVVDINPQMDSHVGDIIKFSAKVTDTSGRPINNVQFTVAHWHTEDEKVVFGTKAVGPDGSLSWQFNAHDGVPYEIRVTAAPTSGSSVQFAPLSVKPVAFVEALQPPLRVKLLNLFYLVLLVGLGVATGLWLSMKRAAAMSERAPARRGPVVRPGLA
jgi:hypothetical protein